MAEDRSSAIILALSDSDEPADNSQSEQFEGFDENEVALGRNPLRNILADSVMEELEQNPALDDHRDSMPSESLGVTQINSCPSEQSVVDWEFTDNEDWDIPESDVVHQDNALRQDSDQVCPPVSQRELSSAHISSLLDNAAEEMHAQVVHRVKNIVMRAIDELNDSVAAYSHRSVSQQTPVINQEVLTQIRTRARGPVEDHPNVMPGPLEHKRFHKLKRT